MDSLAPVRVPGLVIVIVLALGGVVSGCGRAGFDPIAAVDGDGSIIGDGGGSSGDGGGSSGDGGGSSGDGGGTGDGASGTCVDDLSNVGNGDFEIRFTIQTTITGRTALLFQRAACTNAPHWDVYLGSGGNAGRAVLGFSDGSSSGSMPTTSLVVDGTPHDVVYRRLSGMIDILVDGANEGGQSIPLTYGVLPAMRVESGHPCAAVQPLIGTLSNVCVRPL